MVYFLGHKLVNALGKMIEKEIFYTFFVHFCHVLHADLKVQMWDRHHKCLRHPILAGRVSNGINITTALTIIPLSLRRKCYGLSNIIEKFLIDDG